MCWGSQFKFSLLKCYLLWLSKEMGLKLCFRRVFPWFQDCHYHCQSPQLGNFFVGEAVVEQAQQPIPDHRSELFDKFCLDAIQACCLAIHQRVDAGIYYFGCIQQSCKPRVIRVSLSIETYFVLFGVRLFNSNWCLLLCYSVALPFVGRCRVVMSLPSPSYCCVSYLVIKPYSAMFYSAPLRCCLSALLLPRWYPGQTGLAVSYLCLYCSYISLDVFFVATFHTASTKWLQLFVVGVMFLMAATSCCIYP